MGKFTISANSIGESMTNEQLQVLADELASDPLSRGYSTMNDVEVSDSLNEPGREVDRSSLDTGLVMSAIVDTEFLALQEAAKEFLSLLVLAQNVPLTDTLKSNLGRIFPAGSETRANLIALVKRSGSRAEEIGLGRVTPSHIADARRLP